MGRSHACQSGCSPSRASQPTPPSPRTAFCSAFGYPQIQSHVLSRQAERAPGQRQQRSGWHACTCTTGPAPPPSTGQQQHQHHHQHHTRLSDMQVEALGVVRACPCAGARRRRPCGWQAAAQGTSLHISITAGRQAEQQHPHAAGTRTPKGAGTPGAHCMQVPSRNGGCSAARGWCAGTDCPGTLHRVCAATLDGSATGKHLPHLAAPPNTQGCATWAAGPCLSQGLHVAFMFNDRPHSLAIMMCTFAFAATTPA